MRNSYIYKITNPIGQVYIGQTVNLQKRIKSYKHKACKRQKLIYNSLVKYGWENHCLTILYNDICTKEELNDIEIVFISLNLSYWYDNIEYGLNLTKGGGSFYGYKHTAEDRLKMSITQTGRKVSKETCEKMSKSKMGHKRSLESIRKTQIGRKNNPNLPHRHTDEQKEKIGRSSYKTVIQLTLDGQFVKKWEAVIKASKELNITGSGISFCCNPNHYRKSAGGFIWVYEKDYDNTKIYKKISHSEIIKKINAGKRAAKLKPL